MTKIFVDFDGTLTDPRSRLYSLFQELAPESSFSFDEYWHHKRNRISQADMLRTYLTYSDEQISAFKKAWMHRIEEPERIATDKPLPGAEDFLKRASRRMSLYLVTARQFPDRLHHQIQQLGWQRYFVALLVTGQKTSKDDLIRRNASFSAEDTLIGDTGEDILCGKSLGLRTVAVCSGVLSRDILAEYSPDAIVDSVADLEATA